MGEVILKSSEEIGKRKSTIHGKSKRCDEIEKRKNKIIRGTACNLDSVEIDQHVHIHGDGIVVTQEAELGDLVRLGGRLGPAPPWGRLRWQQCRIASGLPLSPSQAGGDGEDRRQSQSVLQEMAHKWSSRERYGTDLLSYGFGFALPCSA